MGMIDGAPLVAEDPPPGYRRRVVVKLRDEIPVDERDYRDYDPAEGPDRLGPLLPRWPELEDAVGPLALVRLFTTLTPEQVRGRIEDARSRNAAYGRNLLGYFAVDCPEDVDPHAVAGRISAWDDVVEVAYVETRPLPPPALIPPDPDLNPRRAFQTYLKIADTHAGTLAGAGAAAFHANGVGAAYAWCFAGGDGAGVRLVDVEQGWDFDHEDLAAAGFDFGPTGVRGPRVGVSRVQHGHGTAVLGQVVAVPNNRLGGVGIAPGATCLAASEWIDGRFNTPAAILAAVELTEPGDVILLESQAEVDLDGDGTPDALLPREVEPAVFDAILNATQSDRIVVEPAANGHGSLDDRDVLQAFAVPGWRFPGRDAFPDSGAILVAACRAGSRGPAGFSNVGTRVDCFAVGDFVDSTGTGDRGVNHDAYTDSTFQGTSAAAPIVAGAALILQGIHKATRGAPLGAAAMRRLLTDPDLNTPSDDPAADRIGVMPDLVGLITRGLGLAQGDASADPGHADTCFAYALAR